MLRRLTLIALSLVLAAPAAAEPVRVKDLGAFLGARDNALVGYGVVTGLAGTGDSPRSEVTRQALSNVLSRFGANVTADQVRSRNVAAVMVTATFPPSADPGEKLDVIVTSIGDARSLSGGALLLTPLKAADARIYALAQGPLVVGGYRFDAELNREQKNHPTTGVVLRGATVEVGERSQLVGENQALTFILKDADVTTAERLVDRIDAALGPGVAQVRDAKAVLINARAAGGDVYRMVAQIENLTVQPDLPARVVVNERSGTVVAGGDVRISSVVVAQGDIRVAVSVDNEAAQPEIYGGYAPGVRSLVVTNTKLSVHEPERDAVVRFPSTTVADLVQGLSRAHVGTREMIAILQAIQSAGALHADLVVE